jgi:2-polyprenyl-6-methoxyphenol hydroxylase-like FAD-dependent oxidoreductase
MARIIVIGAGVGGLVTGMLLARDGNDVTLLERDPAPLPDTPDDAWERWERRGVNQFRMIHMFLPRFRQHLEAELPDAVDEFAQLGAIRFNPFEVIPAEFTGGYRPDDAQFTALTARRPVAETALGRAAAKTPGLEVRRGVAVKALVTDDVTTNGVRHMTGVRTDAGDELHADLVIDAAGRRSALPALLADAGARTPREELEDCGFVYYGRHLRSPSGELPALMSGVLSPWGTISTLTLPCDNGTWGLGIVASAQDPALRALKDPDAWMRVWRSLPLVAHWAEGEPIDGGEVAVMARIQDRHRAFVVDGEPVATGVLAVADSWACTNPSLGRGTSIGFIHAIALRDLLRTVPLDDPVALALAWHDATVHSAEPWYRATLSFDRHRLAEIDALVAGETYDPGDPQWEVTKALAYAASQDPDVLRGMLRVAGVLALPDDVLADPALSEKVASLGAGWRDAEVLAPSRAELLELVGAK